MSKNKQVVTKKEEEEKSQYKGETFDDVIKELEAALTTTAAEYIPRACTALKRHNPLISSAQIRLTILNNPTIKRVWKQSTIRLYWTEWMKNPKAVQAGRSGGLVGAGGRPNKIGIKNILISPEEQEAYEKKVKEVTQKGKELGLTEEEIDKDVEQIPVKSWTQDEYEEEHPEVAESPFEAIGEINRSLARLWTALTKQKNMPTSEDDVMKDYIIPARDRIKDMLNGSSKIERTYLFNWLTWVIMAAKDCRNLCEKADTTAYDTRK